MKLKVFYSWQSDLEFNDNAIREALRLAINDIEKKAENPRIDSMTSTSNLTGTTHIPESILKAIATCDIFICDLTIIGKNYAGTRKIPNPNVAIELGYALSELSWYRTIVIFNERFGELKLDLPFDIEKRSALLVNIADENDTNGKGQLRVKLRDWIQKIIKDNPPRPNRTVVPYQEDKREEDIKSIKKILKFFPTAEMDEFFKNGHNAIDRSFIKNCYDFIDHTKSTGFFLFDTELKRLVMHLQVRVKSMDQLLQEYKGGTIRRTHMKKTGFDTNRFDRAKGYIGEIERAFNELRSYLRQHYFEVKIPGKKKTTTYW